MRLDLRVPPSSPSSRVDASDHSLASPDSGSPGTFRSRVTEPAAIGLGVAAYALLVGYLAIHNEKLAVGAAAIGLVAGAIAGNVARLAIIATAGVWLIHRVPGNISVTDVLIACAGAAALISGAAQAIDPRGRIVLRSFAIYMACLTITLAYNQSLRSDLEWLHRIALVAGAVWAGAWLVSRGLHRAALRLLLAVTLFFATLALADGLRSGFSLAAQPLGYQKNFIGSIVATVFLVLLTAHREFELPRAVLRVSAVVLLGGLFATHSRGAMVAAGVGLLIWFFRESGRARGWPPHRGHSRGDRHRRVHRTLDQQGAQPGHLFELHPAHAGRAGDSTPLERPSADRGWASVLRHTAVRRLSTSQQRL